MKNMNGGGTSQTGDTELEEIASSLTAGQIAALQPCATNRNDHREMIRMGLLYWGTRVGHRFPSLRLTYRGYQIRDYLNR